MPWNTCLPGGPCSAGERPQLWRPGVDNRPAARQRERPHRGAGRRGVRVGQPLEGARSPDEWKPPRVDYWGISATTLGLPREPMGALGDVERDALQTMLATCPAEATPAFPGQPVPLRLRLRLLPTPTTPRAMRHGAPEPALFVEVNRDTAAVLIEMATGSPATESTGLAALEAQALPGNRAAIVIPEREAVCLFATPRERDPKRHIDWESR